MSSAQDRRAEQPFAERKIRDRALILPLVGLILLIPPMANIFQIDAHIYGVPFTAFYLFVVWGLLILGAALLSRRLRDAEESFDEPSSSREVVE